MPELPDVQVFKEYVDATSLHQRITGLRLDAADLRETVSARTLKKRLEGRELRSTRRHGKHLFLQIEGDAWLRLHFGMTGGLKYYKGATAPEHTKLRLDFPHDYHLAYIDVRKLGEIGFVDDPDAFVDEEGLGPDALALDAEGFRERLGGRRGTLKSTLMNQEVLAGLGNVYADEILFQADLHPQTATAALDDADLDDLHESMREVIEEAVRGRVEPGRMPPSFLLPRRRDGEACPRCEGMIEKTEVVGRPTFFCSRHQKRKD